MDRNTHLLCEAVQEVTLAAWPVIWADNKYDQDSRYVLETLRYWAEEFENWWLSKDQDYIDTHDWLEAILAFTDIRCKEYLRAFGDVVDGDVTRDTNLQEFTSKCIEDSVWHVLFFDKNMSRKQCFALIRTWADDFWNDYCKRDAFEDYKNGKSYYDLVDEFILKKSENL